MSIQNLLQSLLEERLQSIVKNQRFSVLESDDIKETFGKKNLLLMKREAEIIKASVKCKPIAENEYGNGWEYIYSSQFQYLIKQQEHFYVEEEVQYRKAYFENGRIVLDIQYEVDLSKSCEAVDYRVIEKGSSYYSRLNSVKYAELYWKERNPDFPNYQNNCTNYISQCLLAGLAPMAKYGDERNGWWHGGNKCSLSWSTSHSLRWFLSGAKYGLRGKEVKSAKNLLLGDIIFYDFQGDGRWDHVTIVTAKDKSGQPLVNANTFDCRKRYWTYEDSTAYTPNIQYKFIHIVDDKTSEL